MKKVLAVIFGLMFMLTAHAGQIVNVDYVHRLIQDKWNIIVPVNNLLPNRDVAVNMEYLLAAIDVANKKLNGWPSSSYASTEYATTAAADTVAAQYAVEKLIKFIGFPFKLTTTGDTKEFQVTISAKGKFYINWGDGTVENISKKDVSERVVSHRYDSPGAYKVKLGGVATGYDTSTYPGYWIPAISAIAVSDYWSVEKLYGRLGRVFPTLADGTQPRFAGAFMYSEALTSIPATLFDGIRGELDDYMFYSMFEGSYALTEIPDGLFDGFSGNMGTGVFSYMFANCDGLSGDSAKSDGVYLYNKWPNATTDQVAGMYMSDSGLSDYAEIPSAWK